MDEWQRQQRERARQERTNTRAASESLSNYKNTTLRDEDLKLNALKQEDRRKKQEAHAAMSRYSGTGVSEEALKLKKYKDEQRQKERESKEMLNKAQFNEVKIIPKESKFAKNTTDPNHLPPVVRKQEDDVDFGSVKEKAGLYHHDYDPALGSPRNTKQKSSVQNTADDDSNPVPFLEEEEPAPSVPELAAGLDKAAAENAPTTTDESAAEQSNEEPTPAEPASLTDPKEEENADAAEDVEDTKLTEEPEAEPTKEQDDSEEVAALPETNGESTETKDPAAETENPNNDTINDTNNSTDPPESTSDAPAADSDKTSNDPEAPKVHHLTPTEIDQAQKKEVTGRKFKVRLDVLFSFGLLTSSAKPYLDNYMGAVEEVVKATLQSNDDLRTHCWYDPGYGPFVQEYTTDEHWQDPQQRPNVRRILVIAAIPIFLTNGISIRKAREGVCAGLQKTMKNGEFVAIAKRGGYVDQPSSTNIKDDKYAIM